MKLPRGSMAKALQALRQPAVDLVGLASVGGMLHGLAMIYAPLAWVLGGLCGVTAAWVLSKPAQPRRTP